jgi:formylglycine-generating enzyme required for sulfatase activity
MIRVPAGPFRYGEQREERGLPEFWVDCAPVTNAAYARFVAAADQEPPEHWGGRKPPAQITDHPVTHVSWNDAAVYAQWTGKRLLTEQEWEKAARGNEGREYPWGDWEAGRCNSKEMGIKTTSPVGQFSPAGDSLYGCVDAAGNVWEWTSSEEGIYRILRGGSYNHDRTLSRCTFRVRHQPYYRYRNIGFRLGCDTGRREE